MIGLHKFQMMLQLLISVEAAPVSRQVERCQPDTCTTGYKRRWHSRSCGIIFVAWHYVK